MPLVNFQKIISLLFLRFSREFSKFEHYRGDWAYAEPNFCGEIFFKVEICILIWDFWVIFENFIMRMLSIRGNDFIAHWVHEETISSHTGHMPNEFLRMLILRKNFNRFYVHSYAEHTGKWFYRTLRIRGNDFNAGWAYEEMISSLTEHTRKCLKV